MRWKPVHLRLVGDVVHAGVDLRVEVAEALGDRLDRLVVEPRRAEEVLGLGELARAQRGGEPLRRVDEVAGLLPDVVLVVRDRRREQRVVGLRPGGGPGHGELAVVALRVPERAVERVLAGLQVQREVRRQSRREVLALAHDDPVGVLELDLVGLRARRVRRDDLHRARLDLGVRGRAAAVRQLELQLLRRPGARRRARGRVVRAAACGERCGCADECACGGDPDHAVSSRRRGTELGQRTNARIGTA